MGKARRTRQGVMIRFDAHDAELERWLGQFAHTQSMTKVVKLACYMLAGLQPNEGLLAVLPHVEQTRYTPTAAPMRYQAPNEHNSDALAAVMQELAALREAVAGRPPAPAREWANPDTERHYKQRAQYDGWPRYEDPPADADDGDFVESSGLDMSRGRRGKGGSARPSKSHSPATRQSDSGAPATDGAQVLLASIRAYCDFQGGR